MDPVAPKKNTKCLLYSSSVKQYISIQRRELSKEVINRKWLGNWPWLKIWSGTYERMQKQINSHQMWTQNSKTITNEDQCSSNTKQLKLEILTCNECLKVPLSDLSHSRKMSNKLFSIFQSDVNTILPWPRFTFSDPLEFHQSSAHPSTPFSGGALADRHSLLLPPESHSTR